MPSHRMHRLIDRLLLNKGYPEVHKFADAVLGKGHRKKWGHDKTAVALTYFLTRDIDAVISHVLHIKADEYFSKKKLRI